MNKDIDRKEDPRFDSAALRVRIDQTTKQQYDDTEELDIPLSKTMPVIPVTGMGKIHKYLSNKSPRTY